MSKPNKEIRMEPDEDDDVIDWEDLMSQWRHNWKIDLFSAWQILGDWAILLCLSMGTAKFSLDLKMAFLEMLNLRNLFSKMAVRPMTAVKPIQPTALAIQPVRLLATTPTLDRGSMTKKWTTRRTRHRRIMRVRARKADKLAIRKMIKYQAQVRSSYTKISLSFLDKTTARYGWLNLEAVWVDRGPRVYHREAKKWSD